MLGLSLLFIGAVLVVNAQSLYGRIEARECAPFNFLVGILTLGINILGIVRADNTASLLTAAGGLLFSFTYLYLAAVQWWSLNGSGLGWYCLFVAVNTVVMAALSYSSGDGLVTALWLCWGFLWALFFVALGLQCDLKRWLPHATLVIGVVTCWVPGLLILTNHWPG